LLVCTDVAARGLDIKDVPAVFNFDIPFHAEDYVHRIGRTGRAGQSGLAVTFVSKSDARLVAEIEKLLKTKLDLEPIEFEEDLPDIRKQGHINDGRRMYQQDTSDVPREDYVARAPRAPRSDYKPQRSRSAPADPFFDKPYEPSLPPEAAPSWEAAATRPGVRAISGNIRPKRKVAALFAPV
jgi:superfamily II DNA/RNA helicase